jgi:integrase
LCSWPTLSADWLETYLHGLRTGPERLSVATSNDYLQAVRQFVRWMVANGRTAEDPFKRLKPGNVKLDTRRRRGELTPAEVAALLAAAESSPTPFRGLAGPDRAMIYRVALGTGFRAAELAVLAPDSFDLDATPSLAVLPATATKNRREALQPLSADLAIRIRIYNFRKAPRVAPVAPDVGYPVGGYAPGRHGNRRRPRRGGRAGRYLGAGLPRFTGLFHL